MFLGPPLHVELAVDWCDDRASGENFDLGTGFFPVSLQVSSSIGASLTYFGGCNDLGAQPAGVGLCIFERKAPRFLHFACAGRRIGCAD